MKDISIIVIIMGLGFLCVGIGVLFYTIQHIPKINLNSNYKNIIIILHFLAMIFGTWLIIKSIDILVFAISLLHTILSI